MGVACSASVFGFQVKIGDSAPSFSVTTMGGKQLFFKDMQTGGPIFLYFIRDGDTPTQQQTSYINQMIRDYGTSRVTWYGILNVGGNRAKSYEAEVNPAFRIEQDQNLSAIKSFSLTNGPVVIEFDGSGHVLNTWHGFSAVNLKGMNVAMAAASHKPIHDLDYSTAPSRARFGGDYADVIRTSINSGGG